MELGGVFIMNRKIKKCFIVYACFVVVLLATVLTLSILGAKERIGYLEILGKVTIFEQWDLLDKTGWHGLEETHVWSGEKASLSLPVLEDTKDGSYFVLEGLVFQASPETPIDVHITTIINGEEWRETITSTGGETIISIPIDRTVVKQEINIEVPEAASPYSLGLSADTRVLGIALRKIEGISSHTYHFKIEYHNEKVFRSSDIFEVYLNADSLPEYITSTYFDVSGGRIGQISSRINLTENIDNIHYTLKIKKSFIWACCTILFMLLVLLIFLHIMSFWGFEICNKYIVIDKINIAIFIFAFIVMIIYFIKYNVMQAVYIFGEFDDYLFPIISFINDGNFLISEKDMLFVKSLMPDYLWAIERHAYFSPFYYNGEAVPWYFPLYSIVCLPIACLFYSLGVCIGYAPAVTNCLLYFFLIAFICFSKRLSIFQKIALTIILLCNPAIPYLRWLSAEIFVLVLVAFFAYYWCFSKYRIAAIFFSLAFSLNPTIGFAGLFMILNYLYDIGAKSANKDFIARIKFIFSKYKEIFVTALYFLFVFVPLVYAYRLTGKFHASMGYSQFSTIFDYFKAYLFDLNFGILPYYNLFFVIFLILFCISFFIKDKKFLFVSLGFFATILGYSVMSHINCGMEGISRYNAWSSMLFVFVVILCLSKFSFKNKNKYLQFIVIISLLPVIIFNSYMNFGGATNYATMQPPAKFVLNNFPSLYNPLPSTFHSRINHVDGGYSFSTPIFYRNQEDNITKILFKGNETDKDFIRSRISASIEDYEEFTALLDSFSNDDKYKYINISPKKYKLKWKP